MRYLTAFFLLALPHAIEAQLPGSRVTVDVNVTLVAMRGDTAQITYVLYNRPESQDSLFMFAVDAPARIKYIPRPQPDSLWLVDSLIHRHTPAAFWSMLSLLAPSGTTPPLLYESVGLPGVVTDWALGNWPLPNCCDDDPPSQSEDVLVTRTVQGKTVGVEQWPTDRSAQALLARLRTLTETACATPLQWITDSALCTQLVSDVDTAEAYRASDDNSHVQSTLVHYTSLVGTPGALTPGVTAQAYWLLASNADIIRAMF